MAASDHQAIREYLMRESQGLGNSGRKMVLNPQTGKFEVASQFDSRQDVADITAEDLRSFSELLRDVKAPNKIVLSRTVLECIVREKVPSAQLTYADDGDVVTVTNEPGGELQLLHIDDRNQVASCLAEARRSAGAATVIGIVVDGELQCFVRDSQRDQPIPMTLLPGKVDVFDRVRGVFETDVLAGRSVAVLGLGSGGSFILRELAKCGVGQFLLLDDDRLEIGNVCRHECGLSDVGRLKVNAMREYVLDRHPSASITALPLHIDSDTIGDVSEALRAFSPDIVVCATDNRPSRLIVNRICVREGMPAIYAGVFRRAYGGQVLRVIPQLSPCYQCFISALPS